VEDGNVLVVRIRRSWAAPGAAFALLGFSKELTSRIWQAWQAAAEMEVNGKADVFRVMSRPGRGSSGF
jgi:hypothetical protein